MRQLGLAGVAPGPNTSRPHPQAEVYPCLLRGVAVERPNQVWSTDITWRLYPHGTRVRLPRGGDGLVQPQGAGVADQQHPGRRILRGLPGGSPSALRNAGDFQHRAGLAIYQRGVYGGLATPGDRHTSFLKTHYHARKLSQPSEKTDTATTDEADSYSVESMNHLGLVAAMADELGLVECIDPMMPQDFNQRTVSIGLAGCRLTAPPRQAAPATPPEEGNLGRGIPFLHVALYANSG